MTDSCGWFVSQITSCCYLRLCTAQVQYLLDHFHCYAVDHRGTGDSHLDVPDSALQEALENRSSLQSEWLIASARIPTIQGYAEDICTVASHFAWRGNYHQAFVLAGRSPAHEPRVLVLTLLWLQSGFDSAWLLLFGARSAKCDKESLLLVQILLMQAVVQC